MAKFKELNNNVMKVLMKLIESQDLCKLLHYPSDDPLSEPDIESTNDLLFERIYPIPKIPDVNTETGSYLSVTFDEIKIGTSNIGLKNSLLSFNIMCHIDKWRIDGALRPYAIMNKIDEIFNDQRIIGVGKVQFDSSKLISVNEQFSGYKLSYVVVNGN